MKKTLCSGLAFLLLFIPLAVNAQGELKSGVYYIQNVASGNYLSSGANWGTRAVLSKHGIDFKVTRNSDGTYVLFTNIQGKSLRPSDGYMDQSGNWTVTPLADGTYALFNGTNYFGYVPGNEHPWVPRLDTYTDTSSDNTHWRFVTREDLLATLKTATKDHPVDATFLISAPDFLIGDYRISSQHVWGNDLSATGGHTGGDQYVHNGSNGEFYNKAAFDICQQLTDIPLGVYSLSAQAFYRYGNIQNAETAYRNGTEELLPVLYAGDKSVKVKSIFDYRKSSAEAGWVVNSAGGYIPDNQSNAADCFDSGEDVYLNTIKDISVGNGRLQIGIRKANKSVSYDWCCFDNFTLLYYGADVEALKNEVLKAIEQYESLNTDSDPVFAQSLAEIRQRVNDANDEETLSKAYEEMEAAYSVWRSKAVVEDTPIDLSDMLDNADFTLGLTGWHFETTSVEGASTQWTINSSAPYAIEAYAGYGQLDMTAYKMWQKVTLSPGMYRLKGNAFYRYGSSYTSDTNKGMEISEARIFAGTDSVTVPRLASEEQTTYANSLDEAASVFKKGLYDTQVVFILTETTTLDLGFQGTHSYLKSWFVTGPCRLEKINQDILDKEAEDDFDVRKQKYLTKWNSYKAISKQALQPEIYDSVLDSVKDVYSSVETDEQILAIDARMWSALKQLLTQSTAANGQFDITALVQNPAFNLGLRGWTVEGYPSRTDAGLVEDYNNAGSNVSQILHDMPAGNYTLKAQALYRATGYRKTAWDYQDGKDNVTASLYLAPAGSAKVQKKVHDINDGARILSARPASDVPGAFGRSIPNSVNGVADAFAAGQYWNILRTATTADTDITIGITNQGTKSENWLCFDNFRLYYGLPALDITLDENEKYELTEDTYANVTLNKTLIPGQLNPLCLPFDAPASLFSDIYAVAGVDYDEQENKATVMLIPQKEIKAGQGYFVKVDKDTQIHLDDVLLHAQAPDSIPVIWENAAVTGAYGQFTVRSNYILNEEGLFAFKRVAVKQPGYSALVNLPTLMTNKLKLSTTLPVEIVDFDNMQFSVNIENAQARGLINDNTYTLGSESMVDKYNLAPPANRDHPHTTIIPLPEFSGKAVIALSWETVDPSVTITGQTAASFDIPAGSREVELKNLYPGQAYHFAVTDETSKVIAQGQFLTHGHLRMIKTTTGSNIRDLGGWLTADNKRINYGLVYRGGEMNGGHAMSQADINELKRLGIGAEVDLRSEADLNGYTVSGSVFGKDAPYYFANQYNYNEDALQGDTLFYKNAFNLILDNISQGRAVLFHCIWGADRTGACAMLLEGLLGVTLDQMYKDYELTSFSIAGARHKDGLDSKHSYIRSVKGSSLQMKFYNYWKDQVGIPAERLDEFINLMDGTSVVGIDDITDDNVATRLVSPAIYNLQGQRIDLPERLLPSGIYIIGGRKVMKK